MCYCLAKLVPEYLRCMAVVSELFPGIQIIDSDTHWSEHTTCGRRGRQRSTAI